MFKLVDGISGPAAKMSKGLQGFGGAVAKGGAAVKGAGSKLADFAAKAEPIIEVAKEIGDVLLGLAEKGFEFGKFVVEAAEFKRHSLAALTIVEGSAEAAEQTLKTIQDMSNAAGVNTDSVAKLYQELRAAGFAAKEAQDVIAGGFDVQGVFGGGSGAGVIEALKKIKTLGSFQGKTIKPILQQANIPLDELKAQLAKLKGMTVAEIDAAMDAGKISADEGITAVLATIQTKFDKGSALGTAAKSLISDTIGGQIQTLKNRFGDLFEDSTLGEPLKNALKTINGLLSEESVAGKKLREILGAGLTALTDLLTSLLSDDNVSAAFDAILGVADFIKQGVEFIWPYLEAIGGPMWDGIKEAVEPLIGLFKKMFSGKSGPDSRMLGGLRELGKLLGWIIGVVVDLVAAGTALSFFMTGVLVGALAGVVHGFKAIGEGIVDAYESVVGFFGDLFDTLEDLYDDAIDVGGDFIDGLVQGLKNGWDTVIKTVTGLAGEVVGTIKGKLGISSPSKVMAQMGMFTAVGFSQGMNDNAGLVESSAGGLASGAIGGAVGASLGGTHTSSVTIGDIVVHVPPGTTDPVAFGRTVGAEIRAEVLKSIGNVGAEPSSEVDAA